MGIALSWKNTTQNKKRTLAAVSGIAFSLVLIFMQVGFLDGATTASTLLYDCIDFDLIVTSDRYESMMSCGRFDRIYMRKAAVEPGVAGTGILNLAGKRWTNPDTEEQCSILLVGVDDDPAYVLHPEIRDNLSQVAPDNTIMLDRLSHKDYGDVSVGTTGTIQDVDVRVTANFDLGVSLFTEGSGVTNHKTFARLTGVPARMASFGLIKIDPNANLQDVKRRLRNALPADVFLFDRDEFIRQEQAFFISVKPVGIVFQTGVLVSFMVGMVILYQVLSTEVSNRLSEYATLKAVGFSTAFIYRIGINQALFFSVLSYSPALIVSLLLYHIIRIASRLPMHLDPPIALFVLALTIVMCSVSGYLALRKLKHADPADLF